MKKNLEKISELNDFVDCFIQIVDARIPISGINNFLNEKINKKNFFILYSKVDRTDKKIFQLLIQKNNNICDKNLSTLSSWNQIYAYLKKINIIQNFANKFMVVGSPNTGKSTFIKKITKKNVKIENRPGSTRSVTYFKIDDFNLLVDTPGILYPKFATQDIAIKHVLCNLISEKTFDGLEILVWSKNYLKNHYPSHSLYQNYFRSESLNNDLHFLAKALNHKKKNNELDIEKTISFLIYKLQKTNDICWDKDLLDV